MKSKHQTANKELLEELNSYLNVDNSRVEVLSVNDKQTKEELLRCVESERKRRTVEALDNLQRAVSRYDATVGNMDEKIEKPYRQKVIEMMTNQFVESVGRRTFWGEYTQQDRMSVWKRITNQVKDMKFDEVVDYIVGE